MVRNSHWYVEPLKRQNYDTWKVEAQAVLVEHGLWGYVNGSMTRPIGMLGRAEYENMDIQAKSELLLMISPSILERVNIFNSSKALWDSLEEIFQNMDPNFNMDPPPKTKLIKQLLSMKMNEGENVRIHLNTAFETVNTLAEMGTVIDSDFLSVMLLNSLPPPYETFRQATECLDNLPPPEDLQIEIITESYLVRSLPAGSRCGESGHDANDRASNRSSDNNGTLEQIIFPNNYTEGHQVWYLDSGSPAHMSGDREKFENFTEHNNGNYVVKMGSDNFKAQVRGTGKVTLNLPECDTDLFDTYYVPSLSMNLISVSKITDRGYYVLFETDCATVRSSEGRVLLRAQRSDGLYVLEARPNPGMENEIRPAPELNVNEQTNDRESIMRPIQASNTLDIVHSDVCGPMQVQTDTGSRFFVTFVDEHTRLSCVYALNSRSEVLDRFVDYKSTVERCTGRKIQFLAISDGKGDFGTWKFNRYLRRTDITRMMSHDGAQHSSCNRPSQNNIAGPHNRMLVTKANNLIQNSQFVGKSWYEAIYAANYWYNRTPLEVLNYETPLKRWMARVPRREH